MTNSEIWWTTWLVIITIHIGHSILRAMRENYEDSNEEFKEGWEITDEFLNIEH